MVVWELYIWSQVTMDCDPELLLETADLKAAVTRVHEDFKEAHTSCPDKCVDPKDMPVNVAYDAKYARDEKGAFFTLPEQPDEHNIINIAAIYEGCTVEYYVIRKD
jgi:hypothetical protein